MGSVTVLPSLDCVPELIGADLCELARDGEAASRRTVGLQSRTLCVTHLYTEPVTTHPAGGGRPAPAQIRPGPAPLPLSLETSSLLSNKPLELSVLPVSGVSERREAFLSSLYFFLFGGARGASGGFRLISWDPQAAACQPPPVQRLLLQVLHG